MANHYSSLVPELFRHKTTQVRVFRPQVILLDFHGTISERHWEDKVIYPYVWQALRGFLQLNWNDEIIQRCLPELRSESFEQHFRNKFEEAPVISEFDGQNELEPEQLASQMSDFLLWQMHSKKETHETQLIERLVWRDGLKHDRITTPIYDEVLPCVRDWTTKDRCSIYVVSSLDADTLKLLFEHTNKGNLHQYLKGYLTAKRPGEKLTTDLYRQIYEKLGPTLVHSSGADMGVHKNPSKSLVRRPFLFLTDSGQEAKAASKLNDGTAFECLLVDRPGNKPLRTFYLSQFAYIERLDDITFIG